MGEERRMKPLKYKVRYSFEIGGEPRSGVEDEASWFYVDQRGKFFDSGPMRPISPCSDQYTELTPLIKINDEYLSIDEIEQRVSDLQKFHDMFIKHNVTDEETELPNRS